MIMSLYDSNDNDSIYINVTSIHAACYLCQALTSTIKLILSVTDFHLIQFLLSNFTNYLSHNISTFFLLFSSPKVLLELKEYATEVDVDFVRKVGDSTEDAHRYQNTSRKLLKHFYDTLF